MEETEYKRYKLNFGVFKICRKCDKLKMLSDFTKEKRYPEGRAAICKECSAKRIADWREKNAS